MTTENKPSLFAPPPPPTEPPSFIAPPPPPPPMEQPSFIAPPLPATATPATSNMEVNQPAPSQPRNFETRDIRSIQDLLVALAADNEGYQGSIWYRGHANFAWTLQPGYLRLTTPPSESTLMKQFKQSAAMLVDVTPTHSFDWLFWMQHYGVPTRLLDWSESPLVALYFAVEACRQHTGIDAALWSLRPSELNKNAGINNANEEFFIPSFDDQELTNYTVEILNSNFRSKLKPLATIATRNNARIQAQHGVFTIHHHDPVAIELVGDQSHVIKYRIPSDCTEQILKQLSLLGITKFQMFPELSSIGDIIKERLN